MKVGGPVASAGGAGRHKEKDALTGRPQEERWITEQLHISVKEKIMNIRYVFILCTALVVGGAFLTGCQATEKTPITDSYLTSKAKIALFADARVKGRQIVVETTNGQVMLRGKVDSDAARQAAEGIAKGLDGVKSVKNDLEVVAPSAREAVEDKDETLTAHVKEDMAKDSVLKNADIAVQTNAGVVSLTGEVSNIMTSANASWIAWQVPGVQSVKNDLTLKEKT
jgi:osmotically-inducible protein OsmY